MITTSLISIILHFCNYHFLSKQDELLKLAESNNKLLDKENRTAISGKKAVVEKQDGPKGNL